MWPNAFGALRHGDAQANAEQREFELLPGVTVIGSGADADLRLAGLEEHHAEVRRDADTGIHRGRCHSGARGLAWRS